VRIILPLLGLPVLGVVPLITGTVLAAQPLADNQMDRVTAGVSVTADANVPAPPLPGVPVPFCGGPCPPPAPPPNAPPSVQFSYMLTINGIGLPTDGTGIPTNGTDLPTNGISLQALLVRP